MSDDWETVRGAMDSLAWLMNNAQNHDSDDWPGLVKAARDDRDRGLVALRSLRREAESMQEALRRIAMVSMSTAGLRHSKDIARAELERRRAAHTEESG